MLDNALQHYHWSLKKNSFFIKKNWFTSGTRTRREYPNSLGVGKRFNFSSPLGMGRVMGRYMRVRDKDMEDKTRLHPAPLSCLPSNDSFGVIFSIIEKLLLKIRSKQSCNMLIKFGYWKKLNQRMRTHGKEEKASTIKLPAQEVTGTT